MATTITCDVLGQGKYPGAHFDIETSKTISPDEQELPMTRDRRYYIIALALSICVLLETLSLTYLQQSGSTFYYSSSILYLLSGLAVCILPLVPVSKISFLKTPARINKSIPYLLGAFILFLIGHHIVRLTTEYSNMPIDARIADMLPCLQVACRRFLHGEVVYGPAPEIYPGSIIPYLPAMWIPFIPASILGFDFRWVTVAMQLFCVGLAMMPVLNRNRSIPLLPAIIGAAALFLLFNYFLYKRTDYWTMTEEGVVAGFYLLLSLALLRRNYWLIGLAIMCCTLSRYSLILWIPVYFGFVFLTRPRSDFWKLFLSYTGGMLAVFVIPFFIRDPLYFIHIPRGYIGLTDRFWHSYGVEEHLLYNVGLFKFFSFGQVHNMLILEVITSFLAPLILILSALWLKKRFELNDRYFAYASFKISMVFFYAFIQMPYLYVFVPLTLMSFAVLFDYLAGQGGESSAPGATAPVV
ncbi:MAG: hypothetical protein JWO03_984 [Bacteroidetes bacterium]|nr:hypothetical protein [Bacteroidota bacterium]